MKIIVPFDGSLNAQTALKYGLEKVNNEGGQLTALHIFQSNMFIDYDAHPGAEEVARKEALGYAKDAERIISESGSTAFAKAVMIEGDPEIEIPAYAREERADLIITSPRYRSVAKSSPCPVSIVPGTILVPIDKIDYFNEILGLVTREARAMDSKVVLLGVVPIHMYSGSEKKEIDEIKREISTALKKAAKLLREEGIETKELLRSGYPDEEIAKVAEELPTSVVIIPEGGDTPSELAKAAAVLISEADGFKKPIFIAHTA